MKLPNGDDYKVSCFDIISTTKYSEKLILTKFDAMYCSNVAKKRELVLQNFLLCNILTTATYRDGPFHKITTLDPILQVGP